MSSRHIPTADGVSRFLSMIAILAAIGSAVFLHNENQKLKADLAKLQGSDPDAFVSHASQWDKDLTGALDEFKVRADKHLKEFDQARIARNDIANQVDMQTLTLADVEDLINERLPSPPNLRVAQTALKPLDGSSAPMMIANDGGIVAEIIAARFVPTLNSQFETDLPQAPGADQVVIRFSKGHNNPTKANHHRLYERRYLLPEQAVNPNRTAKVSVEIANNKHVEWGMKGQLELEYQDGRTLTIPSVEAVFVPEKVKTT